MTNHSGFTGRAQQAAVGAALVVLKSMGLTLEDLAAPGSDRTSPLSPSTCAVQRSVRSITQTRRSMD